MPTGINAAQSLPRPQYKAPPDEGVPDPQQPPPPPGGPSLPVPSGGPPAHHYIGDEGDAAVNVDYEDAFNNVLARTK